MAPTSTKTNNMSNQQKRKIINYDTGKQRKRPKYTTLPPSVIVVEESNDSVDGLGDVPIPDEPATERRASRVKDSHDLITFELFHPFNKFTSEQKQQTLHVLREWSIGLRDLHFQAAILQSAKSSEEKHPATDAHDTLKNRMKSAIAMSEQLKQLFSEWDNTLLHKAGIQATMEKAMKIKDDRIKIEILLASYPGLDELIDAKDVMEPLLTSYSICNMLDLYTRYHQCMRYSYDLELTESDLENEYYTPIIRSVFAGYCVQFSNKSIALLGNYASADSSVNKKSIIRPDITCMERNSKEQISYFFFAEYGADVSTQSKHKDLDHSIKLARLMLKYNKDVSNVADPTLVFFINAAGMNVSLYCMSLESKETEDDDNISYNYTLLNGMEFDLRKKQDYCELQSVLMQIQAYGEYTRTKINQTSSMQTPPAPLKPKAFSKKSDKSQGSTRFQDEDQHNKRASRKISNNPQLDTSSNTKQQCISALSDATIESESSISDIKDLVRLSTGGRCRLFSGKLNDSEVIVKETTQNSNEVEVLNSVRHPNIIRPVDIMKNGYIIMKPYWDNINDLLALMGKQHLLPSNIVDIRIIQQITIDCLRGLKALHDAGFCHNDIKPSNIVFGEECDDVGTRLLPIKPLLIDFELSEKPSNRHNRCGTVGFKAPESMRDERSDVCSLGITLFNLSGFYTGEKLSETRRYVKSIKNLLNAYYDNTRHMMLLEFTDLILSMTMKLAELRPTVQQCLDHKFCTML
jgi:serine/threonine protein kinase